MLPKRRRLSAREVKEVMTRGRSRRASLLSAKYVAGTSPLRSSAVVSKKVAKKAVKKATKTVKKAVKKAPAKKKTAKKAKRK